MPGGLIEKEAAKNEQKAKRAETSYSSVKDDGIPRYEDVYKHPHVFVDAEGRTYHHVTKREFPRLYKILEDEEFGKAPEALLVVLPRRLILSGELTGFPSAEVASIDLLHVATKKVVTIVPARVNYPEKERRSVGLIVL